MKQIMILITALSLMASCTVEETATQINVTGLWRLESSVNPDMARMKIRFYPHGKCRIVQTMVVGEGRFCDPPIESFMDTVTQEPTYHPYRIEDDIVKIYQDESMFTYSIFTPYKARNKWNAEYTGGYEFYRVSR